MQSERIWALAHNRRGVAVIPAKKTLVNQRANPHPSGKARYDVKVIDQDEGAGLVCVSYINAAAPWWITEQAWREWKKLAPR